MPGSGLLVGTSFPVPTLDDSNQRRHRRQIAEAANYANAAAFTPETQLAQFDDPVLLGTGGWSDLDIDLSITPYIPARAHVIMVGELEFTGQAGAAVRITENGSEVAITSAIGTDQTIPYTIQILRDLQPNTKYTYEIEAIESPALPGTVQASIGTHTLRIEARRLPP